MAFRAIGERVGAMAKADDSTVWIFGYGVYDGPKIPPKDLGVTMMGIPVDWENPCIRLDSGKLVFGCECWWGSEEQIKRKIGARAVVELDIETERAAVATP